MRLATNACAVGTRHTFESPLGRVQQAAATPIAEPLGVPPSDLPPSDLPPWDFGATHVLRRKDGERNLGGTFWWGGLNG
jgi:hypothetical protein